MSSPSFDTHAFIKRLKDAGISEIQAEAHTEALTQALEQFRIEARLADLASKRDLKEVEVRLEARIAETESRLGIRIKEIETSLLKWVIGLLLAQTGVLITAFKLFSH